MQAVKTSKILNALDVERIKGSPQDSRGSRQRLCTGSTGCSASKKKSSEQAREKKLNRKGTKYCTTARGRAGEGGPRGYLFSKGNQKKKKRTQTDIGGIGF